MIAPYDYEALWLKAKMFLNRAMDQKDSRPFDERALWATLALELLAKAALARTSPVLIAEPTEEGTNLLIATGLLESKSETRFVTVRAKTLFQRCQLAFRPFNATEAGKMTAARNDYLHGATPGFTSIPEDSWWPLFWRQAIILNTAVDRELDDLVGSDREAEVQRHLDQNRKNIEHRLEMLIQQARTRLAQHNAGTLPTRIAKQWSPGTDRTIGHSYSDPHPCPACTGKGLIEGDYVNDTRVEGHQIHDDDWETTVELDVLSDYFSCWDCGLVLDNYELLEQAGLPDTFTTEGDDSDIREPDYGND
ncbi:hypothetical protein BJF87_22620 [Gordonia sp. CNJ-863]|uniref:hypothetical protein n=1 Tax=Gordonia sp. CNJ-863 TaxID=1904963 RepID=UPI000969F689|nr:hypothetical protein [Gordonia sp. CNJ-863]OLT46447.1 hypothetical protein BJF87_22620 [Gordonia sp. CNJ-863]